MTWGRYNPEENKRLVEGLLPRPEIEVKPGDLILSRANTPELVGRAVLVKYTPPQLLLSDKLLRLRVDPNRAVADFVNILLGSAQCRMQIEDAATGSSRSMKNISQEKLRQIVIPVPPLPEQRKIAAILSSVDDTIEKTQAVIDELQAVKKAMMQELLTRGIPGRHTSFKQTPIGHVPETWAVVPLGEVLSGLDAGWSPQCESEPPQEGRWGVLKVSAVTSGVFLPQESKALPEGLVPRIEIEVHAGDVLLARANGVLSLVGRTAYVSSTRPKLMLSDKLLRLRFEERKANSLYIHFCLQFENIRQQLVDRTGGSQMRNISQAALREVLVPVPSLQEQTMIADAIHSVLKEEEHEVSYQRELARTKTALLSLLLTGEIRVTLDPEPCP
ncbi:restriction endonuclease subunit S [Chondromyces apiculatus]|uniref:restriction endonuclease subunit S n=1 Tax=Chondromyces apiculatus TaxID=51 RepID=UPI0018CC65F1|nr:restriction endonuclease subunit S [Chondromyces apiculatus]